MFLKRDGLLLNLPAEILRQILREALISEILSRSPYPFGRHTLPYDRYTLSILSPYSLHELKNEYQHDCPFWGNEPMTRIMRVNRKLYDEVYQILWSEFAIHRAWTAPVAHNVWVHWLCAHNPRAITLIRHIQIHWGNVLRPGPELPGLPQLLECEQKEEEKYIRDLHEEVNFYPNLRSVRFQVRPRGMQHSESAISGSVEKWKLICNGLKSHIEVKTFLAPDPGTPEPTFLDLIQRCQNHIGQRDRNPGLHHEMLAHFPEK